MRLQVADHGGTASEEAQAHLALVGFLPGMDAQVVGELPRVGEAFPTVATAVPFPAEGGGGGGSGSPVVSRAAVGQDSRGQALHGAREQLGKGRPLRQPAGLPRGRRAAGRPPLQTGLGSRLVPVRASGPRGLAGMQVEVILEGNGGAEGLRAQEAVQLLGSGAPEGPQLLLLRRRLLCVGGRVLLQQGAVGEAARTPRAAEDVHGEVCEGVPQQSAQGGLLEVAHGAAQAPGTHVAQQVVSEGLPGGDGQASSSLLKPDRASVAATAQIARNLTGKRKARKSSLLDVS